MELFLTTGQVAQQANIPLWKAQYLIKTRGIKPIGRAGVMRMFSPDVVGVLRSELHSIQAKKERVAG